MNEKRCIVMLSGGLDSRLALKIMKDQGFEVTALFFKLPFGGGCCSPMECSFNFSQKNECKLNYFDCTKEELLKEYLEMLKNPAYSTGKGVNPCIDCRLFMLRHAKEYADEKGIDLIVTGEVLGERPMSQMRKSSKIVEEESGLKGRLLRPLSAKLFKETEAERSGLVEREKLYAIQGRKRDKQIELAKKYNIDYPNPAGGCLLCEKALEKKFRVLIQSDLITEKTLPLVNVGRHFYIPLQDSKDNKNQKVWFIVGRDENENNIIESFESSIKSGKGNPAVFFHNVSDSYEKAEEKAKELQKVYSTGASGEERNKFNKWKL